MKSTQRYPNEIDGWSDDSTVVPKDENEIDDSTVPDEPEIRKILSQAPLKLNFYDEDYQRRMEEFVIICLRVLETSAHYSSETRYRFAKGLVAALKLSDDQWSWMPLSKEVRANAVARIQVLQKSYQSSDPTNDE